MELYCFRALKLIRLYKKGRIKLDELITKRHPLEEVNAALEDLQKGRASERSHKVHLILPASPEERDHKVFC